MGRIGLPLCRSQAVELKRYCEQAPYGRRQETIVDTSVRNAWQLDASRLTIGPTIKKAVTLLVPQLANDRGCQGVTIKALPYKLVLYEEGGFFLPHRDMRECLPPWSFNYRQSTKEASWSYNTTARRKSSISLPNAPQRYSLLPFC